MTVLAIAAELVAPGLAALFGAGAGVLAARLGALRGAGRRGSALPEQERLAALEERLRLTDRALARSRDEVALERRRLRAQMQEIAQILRGLSEAQRAADGVAARRGELMIRRLADQVERLADRVLVLEARSAARAAGPASDARLADPAPPDPAGAAERLPEGVVDVLVR